MAKKSIGLSKDESLGMKEAPLVGDGVLALATKKRKRRKRNESFKDSLKCLLDLEAPEDSLAEVLKQTPLGNKINYREAILLAQIIKAYNGDTQAAVFVRDSSGNKLKDGEKEEKKKKFEDF